MVASENRFHGHKSMDHIFRRGRTINHQPHFQIRYSHNKSSREYRLAIIVSKKVSKKAVVRNRIRRRLYEAFRTALKDQPVPLDIAVIVYRPDIADWQPPLLKKELAASLDKLKRTGPPGT